MPLINTPNNSAKRSRHIDLNQSNFDPIKEMEGKSGEQLLKDLKEAEEQYERGEFTDWEDLKKELKL